MLRQAVGTRRNLADSHAMSDREQLVNPDPRPGDPWHDWNTKLTLEPTGVDGNPVASSLVNEVEIHDDAVGNLENLQNEVEIALEPGGINDNDRDVGASKQHEITCDLFVRAARLERVGARQIDDLHTLTFVAEGTFGPRDRLARPIARVLAKTSQGIEHRALADVRISGKRKEDIPLVRAQPKPDQVLCPVLGTSAARGCRHRHQATSLVWLLVRSTRT